MGSYLPPKHRSYFRMYLGNYLFKVPNQSHLGRYLRDVSAMLLAVAAPAFRGCACPNLGLVCRLDSTHVDTIPPDWPCVGDGMPGEF